MLGFLAVNDDAAFRAREIARLTELERDPVSTALTRLKERGLVEHKGPYWAVTTDETRLERHGGYARATALLNDRFGTENEDDWMEHAPDEPRSAAGEDDE